MNWINNAVIYNIYPLGCFGCPEYNDFNQSYRMDKIYDFIPNLKKLGINAIVFNPVFESTKHGYDTIDLYKIDSRLGDNESFKKICKTLHENGIRILLDGVFNHVGRDFFAFKDIQQNGQNSKYCGWFNNINFNGHSAKGDNFTYEGWAGHYSLVKLNLNNEEVVNYLLNAVAMWIDEFDIDGLRLDAADVIDINFFKRLKQMVKSKKEDFWMYGEIVSGDYNRWANNETLDSVTNYELYKPIFSSQNDNNFFEFAHSLDREYGDWGMYKNLYLYNFVDNHDQSRIASKLNDISKLKNVYTMLFTIPGVPSIYYGSEYGILGKLEDGGDAQVRKVFNPNDNQQEFDFDLFNHISRLSKLKHSLDALKFGKIKNVMIQLDHLCYSMSCDSQKIYVLLNQSNDTKNINFGTGFNGYLTDVLNENIKYECHDWVNIEVKPKSSMVLVENDGSFTIEYNQESNTNTEINKEKNNNIELIKEEIVIGKYKHFKGNEYEVIGFATHSETNEKMVIYKALYGQGETYVRPYDMFNEIIERDGRKLRRFQKM